MQNLDHDQRKIGKDKKKVENNGNLHKSAIFVHNIGIIAIIMQLGVSVTFHSTRCCKGKNTHINYRDFEVGVRVFRGFVRSCHTLVIF